MLRLFAACESGPIHIGTETSIRHMSLQEIISELPRLSPEERREVQAKLSELDKANGVHSQHVDISAFAGSIEMHEDPMEYQRRMRAEWT